MMIYIHQPPPPRRPTLFVRPAFAADRKTVEELRVWQGNGYEVFVLGYEPIPLDTWAGAQGQVHTLLDRLTEG